MTQDISWQKPSQVVARRMREIRNARGFSAADLARRCEEAGAPHLDRSIIANIENGRRRNISIDEVLLLALVLDVAPVHLFVPIDEMAVQVGKWVAPAGPTREWVRGNYALPKQDKRQYFTQVPENEWSPPAPRPAATPEQMKAWVQSHGGEVIFVPNPEEGATDGEH